MVVDKISNDPTLFTFYCPGCKYGHHIKTGEGEWSFNMDFEKPTVTPSLLVFATIPERRCHSIITDGKIHYCEDSYHELKGQTVDMVDWDKT
jgi:hypothetical protein